MMVKIANSKSKLSSLVIVAVVVLGFCLRVWRIWDNPPSLNWDEVSHGYNAYSLLKTAKDEWGNFMPIIFRIYGDYKLPGYIYLTVPSVLLFGLTEFAVRLPSVLAGTLSILLTYLLIIELFKKSRLVFNSQLLALLSAFLMAVEPWSLFLSRGAFEANLAQMFIIAGAYFFLKGINFKTTYYYLLSIVSFGLSVWTYNSARVFAPLLILVIVFLYKRQLRLMFSQKKRLLIGCLLIIGLFFMPMFVQLVKPVGLARYKKVSIINEGSIGKIISYREHYQLSQGLERLLFNRYTYFARQVIINWTKHFSGKFLYFSGGSNYQFSIPGRGLMYIIGIPFLLIGVISLVIRRDRAAVFILCWFYFGAVASSVTNEAPHVLRSITMLPTPMILTAYGVVFTVEKIKAKYVSAPKFLYVLFIIVAILSLRGFLEDYFLRYQIDYSWSWQYGYKQAVDYVRKVDDKYDKIVFTKKYGEPHEFILFYWPWDPTKYQNDKNLIRFEKSDWFWVDSFDKFYFINEWDIPVQEWEPFVLESGVSFDCNEGDERCLLVTSKGKAPKTWKKLETIPFLDGKIAFEIYEK